MPLRALRFAALIVLLGAAPAAPSHLWASTSPSLSVRAGVGGAARPGRWLPVDVTVTAGDTALTGTVTVEWGGAVARRDLDLAASSTARVTLLVRTIAASPGIRVSIVSLDRAILASSDVPLTLVPADVDAPIRLCIGDVTPEAACAVRIPDAEAPTNARAYDLADEIVWPNARAASRDAARAYALWQATRWWQDSGSVDPVVAPFDRVSRLEDRTALSLAWFVAALVLATSLAAWRRAPALLLAGIPVAMAAGGVALVTRSSRDIDIQSASFIHQFAGVAQSAVLMKGEVEHPGGATVTITPDLADATIDVAHGLQNTESAATADGQAIYRHTAGRGARSRFELRGSLDHAWLTVTESDHALTLENRAPFPLRDCALRSTGVVAIGTVAAGASARTAVSASLSPGDAVVCTLPVDWLDWSAPGANVRTRGSAFLVFHAWPVTTVTPLEPRASR